MDGHNHCLPLYSKLIEESLNGSHAAYYRADYLAFNPWKQHLKELNRERRPRPCRLLYVKLAGIPVLRVRLPTWVSVQMVPR